MKTNICAILILFVLGFNNSYAQANFSFNQTFPSMNATNINLEVESNDIVVKRIKGSRIVIEMLVEVSSSNTHLLEFLVEEGRYNLEKSFDDKTQTLTLSTKKNKNTVTIKGEEITEKLSYVLYVPENTQRINDSTSLINM